MVRDCQAAFVVALLLARVARAADGDARLPAVDVPTSDSASAPMDERDPTAFTTEIDATQYGGEERSVAELLATAPGATVHRLGDLGQLATVELRGASSDQILVLLDGIPLTSAAGGTVDLSTIPPELIDHIDVLRGDAGARYGAGALGGVVNIVTRRPKEALAEGSLGYGEWQTTDASAAGSLAQGRGGGSLAGSYFQTAGDFDYRFNPTPSLGGAPLQTAIRSNDQSRSAGLVGSGFYSVGAGELTLAGQAVAGERGLAGPIDDPTPNDRESYQRALLGGRLTLPHAIGPVDLELDAHGRADALDVDLAYLGALPQLDLEGGGSVAASLTIGASQHWSVELGSSRETLQASDFGNPARTNLEASLADEITLLHDRILIEPAARFDAQGPFEGLSPKLGVAARLLGPFELRSNVGASFRAPTFAELYLQQGLVEPNPALQPERGESADLGLFATGRRWLVSASAFASSYQNLILYEVFPPFRVKPFNAGASMIEGVEAEASLRPIDSLTLAATYTGLLTWDNDPSSQTYGDPLPYRPDHHAHGRAAWQPGRFLVTLEADWATAQPLNPAGSLLLPGHFVVDAGVGVRLWSRPDLWLTAEAKNLTDDQAPDLFGYPLPGTSVFLNLRGSFSPSATPSPSLLPSPTPGVPR